MICIINDLPLECFWLLFYTRTIVYWELELYRGYIRAPYIKFLVWLTDRLREHTVSVKNDFLERIPFEYFDRFGIAEKKLHLVNYLRRCMMNHYNAI
jgi:hypothetical protein